MGGFAEFAKLRRSGAGRARAQAARSSRSNSSKRRSPGSRRAIPRLNAVVCKLYDSAREAARGPALRPVRRRAVPASRISAATVAGAPTSQGNRRLAEIARDADSELVTRYRKAGLVFVGKTNIPEFGLAPVTESEALGAVPQSLGPRAARRAARAAARAAAVAARFAPMAHATDGGGSIRIPASCCGLVGLKPTRGRTPQRPRRGRSLARPLRSAMRSPVRCATAPPCSTRPRRRRRRAVRNQAAGAALSRRGRRAARQAAHRLHDRAYARPVDPSRLRRRRRGDRRRCCKISATRSSRRRRRSSASRGSSRS